ncbi:hypothetical protein BDV11DRAFT_168508 [Aspergillus similis]
MSVDMDLLFPLDNSDTPKPETLPLYWPCLEKVIFQMVPLYLPSGEWLFDQDLQTGDEEEVPDPSTTTRSSEHLANRGLRALARRYEYRAFPLPIHLAWSRCATDAAAQGDRVLFGIVFWGEEVSLGLSFLLARTEFGGHLELALLR